MNNYTNQQLKIYSDYCDYSSEKLIELLYSKKSIKIVDNIIEDILHERNEPVSEKYFQEKQLETKKKEELKNLNNQKAREEFFKERANNDIIKKFEKNTEKLTDNQIFEIISNYKTYQLPYINAVLIIAEKRELINHEDKAKKQKEIDDFFFKNHIIIEEKHKKEPFSVAISFLMSAFSIFSFIFSLYLSLRGSRFFIHGIIFTISIIILRILFRNKNEDK